MEKVLRRFVDVWKMDFLAKFFAGEYRDTRTTIVFWVLSNIVITLIFSVQACVGLLMVKDDLIKNIQTHVADGASIAFMDGQMTIHGVEDPFFREISAENEGGQSARSVLIIDQRAETYDLGALDEYAGGMIFLHDRAYIKNGSDITQILYSDVPNFSLSKEHLLSQIDRYYVFPFVAILVIIMSMFMFLLVLVFRTIGALWWAGMLYVIGLIMNVHMAFGVAYKSVLNLYFVPMCITAILALANIHIPLLTTVIFVIVFVANLLWFKKNRTKEETVEHEVSVPAVTINAEDGINTSMEK